ncbi:putative O-linked N-acetylglucosamine transferase (SPINDLY family) [Stella humosa]|uniref:protein O-GlcNAc transferase n=1 Tax=Stella humosa TaxID=94 RepID=A0A3N1M9C2_9PROT|nr:glycosyltransferase family 41 protein [Stella humosa]ROQ00271.1 putative O-linked N-acetylglucosamine transferase (SPINDLY family) [Stella humosa]
MKRPQTDDSILAAAERLHRAGRLDEAAAAYRAVLGARPAHAVAWHRLGIVALQAGQPAAALAPLGRAIELAPRDGAMRHDLGHALAGLGRLEDAAAAWAEAGRLAPRMASAHANRGTALAALGRFADAVPAFRAALQADPNHRDAWLGHADSLLQAGRPAEALSALDRARVRLGAHPDFAVVRGLALRRLGQGPAALALLEETVALAPAHAGAWGALGLVRLDGRDDAGAAAALERAEALDPGRADVPFNRATAEHNRDRLGDALAALDRAVARAPAFAAAHLHRGYVLLDHGRPEEAGAAFERVLAIEPAHAAAGSARLFALNYLSDRDGGEVAALHRAWGDAVAAAVPATAPATLDRDPDRRLRIGYLSADFRAHSVAWFLAPLLFAHDRDRVEVIAYADVPAGGDAVTARLHANCDRWRDIHGMDDDAVAGLIRADAVDILVDLGGHTAHSRLPVLARRPAPVQGTWLGYPNTTGLAAVDFRVTDAIADPPGINDAQYSERLVRLDRPFLCYDLPPDAPPPRVPGQPVTFGSFNVPAKISPETVAAWAAILAAVPGARLLLKARGLDDPATAELWRGRFAAAGVDPGRLLLRGRVSSPAGHLAQYGLVDVALDPFPYNGTTTTMEALAMGVPVVGLAGDRHAARVGAAILRPLGLEGLLAEDVRGYVGIAAGLAADGAMRARLRAALPGRLRASSLCDAAGFAAAMEAAYRAEWHRRVAMKS